jgi:putative glutamine amidotransferase
MTEPTDRSPIVGITCDIAEGRARVRTTYAECVTRAGGTPILLPPLPALAHAHADLCDALILTGGDDPLTEPFGCPTHPKASRVNPQRQAYELAILDAFDQRPQKPVLGICLGMQYMALANGGTLDQHLPETTATHADHCAERPHPITPTVSVLAAGEVMSNHHQAISDPGALAIAARAHDGVIEAITDPSRAFYLGVQWHPERTDDAGLGQELFNRLLAAANASFPLPRQPVS